MKTKNSEEMKELVAELYVLTLDEEEKIREVRKVLEETLLSTQNFRSGLFIRVYSPGFIIEEYSERVCVGESKKSSPKYYLTGKRLVIVWEKEVFDREKDTRCFEPTRIYESENVYNNIRVKPLSIHITDRYISITKIVDNREYSSSGTDYFISHMKEGYTTFPPREKLFLLDKGWYEIELPDYDREGEISIFFDEEGRKLETSLSRPYRGGDILIRCKKEDEKCFKDEKDNEAAFLLSVRKFSTSVYR